MSDVDVAAQRRGTLLLVVTALMLAVLVAAAVILGIRDHRHREVDAGSGPTTSEQEALAAARGEAVALTTIGYKTASSDLNRVLAGSTGALRTQFEKEKTQLPATLAKTKSDSRGTVLSSGIASLAGDRAQAVVAVDANVSGTDTGPTGVVKHYRMVFSLQNVNGQWLASDVAFAGAPQ